MFIFGEKSLPDPDLQVLAEHGIQIEVVKNAGHSMAWENPECHYFSSIYYKLVDKRLSIIYHIVIITM